MRWFPVVVVLAGLMRLSISAHAHGDEWTESAWTDGSKKHARPNLKLASTRVINNRITPDSLRPLFHLPLDEAAKLLGVSEAQLKIRSRALGFARWPFSKTMKKTKESTLIQGRGDADLKKGNSKDHHDTKDGCKDAPRLVPALLLQIFVPFGAGFAYMGRWTYFAIACSLGVTSCCGPTIAHVCAGLGTEVTYNVLEKKELGAGVGCWSCLICCVNLASIAFWIWGITVIANKSLMTGDGCPLQCS